MVTDHTIRLNRLQENLPSIRKIAGWRAVDLGNLLGVTKQSISNLETQKSKMTLMQYIAIRHMIDYQIQQQPENKALAHIVPLLLDIVPQSDEEYARIQSAVEEMANAAAAGISNDVLTTISNTLLPKKKPTAPKDWTAIIMSRTDEQTRKSHWRHDHE